MSFSAPQSHFRGYADQRAFGDVQRDWKVEMQG